MIGDSTKRFSRKVLYYEKFRPGYPNEFLTFLKENTNLSAYSVIADIGSGTGISSKMFLQNRNLVYGIEPNSEMRMVAENGLVKYENFISVNGTAEKTTLKEKSVDFIVCAQSFHWFNKDICKSEFLRILKPGGFVFLVWNERKTTGSGFLKNYDELLMKISEDYMEVNHTNITTYNHGVFDFFFGKGNYKEKTFYNEQIFDREGFKGRTLSCSYIPEETDPKFQPLLNGLNELFDRYNVDGKVKFEYDTKLFFGKIL